jgi:hypothetical protein
LGGETILGRQLRLLRQEQPLARIVVVAGYGATDIARDLPNHVSLVVNQDYETTGVVRSIALGARARPSRRLLVVYGDLVFAPQAVALLAGQARTSVLVGDGEGVGAVVQDERVTHFSYGLPNKWQQMALLVGDELEGFLELSWQPRWGRCCAHELFNLVITRGGEFLPLSSPMEVIDVDGYKGLQSARKLVAKWEADELASTL